MFKSVLCVFLGFVLMIILASVYAGVIFNVFPESYLTPEEIVSGVEPNVSLGVNLLMLLCDVVTAALAGYFTAAIAIHKPFEHALALAILIFVMGGLTLLTTFDMEPVWYAVSRLFGAPAAVAFGGFIRFKQSCPKTEVEST
jgi:hypothetical protein